MEMEKKKPLYQHFSLLVSLFFMTIITILFFFIISSSILTYTSHCYTYDKLCFYF